MAALRFRHRPCLPHCHEKVRPAVAAPMHRRHLALLEVEVVEVAAGRHDHRQHRLAQVAAADTILLALPKLQSVGVTSRGHNETKFSSAFCDLRD